LLDVERANGVQFRLSRREASPIHEQAYGPPPLSNPPLRQRGGSCVGASRALDQAAIVKGPLTVTMRESMSTPVRSLAATSFGGLARCASCAPCPAPARPLGGRARAGLRGQASAASVNGPNRTSAAALHPCTRSVVSGLRSHWICRPSIIATICLASSSGRSVSCSASAA
jgi:hypothetical protein